MKNINFGIIGTNFVSDWFCEDAKKTDGINLETVYSRSENQGIQFAEKHGIKNHCTDMKKIFSSVDAVYIASPNFCHFEQARLALESGVHVLLEKPATLERKQFEYLLELAEKKGLVLLEAMRPVHDPALETIRAAMKDIGVLRRVSLEYCQYSSRYDAFKRGEILNAFNPAFGNAAVMDLGCYPLSVAVALFGKPKINAAFCEKLYNGFESTGYTLLEFDGVQADIRWSKIYESAGFSQITGESGSVLIGKISTLDRVELLKRGGEREILLGDREGMNMIYEIENFVSAVNKTLNISDYHEISLTVLELIDQIRQKCSIEFK